MRCSLAHMVPRIFRGALPAAPGLAGCRRRSGPMISTVTVAGAGSCQEDTSSTTPRSCESRLQAESIVAPLCAAVVSLCAPLSVPGLLTAHSGVAVGMACCPMVLGWPFSGDWRHRVQDSLAKLDPEAEPELQRRLLVLTFAQGSLGLARICSGDVYAGSYMLLLATLGYHSRFPEASNWLKTYVLITTINGTMSSVDLLQNYLNDTFPAVSAVLPLRANISHTVFMLSPVIAFLGGYYGWQYVKCLRRQENQRVWRMAENIQLPPLHMRPPVPGIPAVPCTPFGNVQPGQPAAMSSRPTAYVPKEEPTEASSSSFSTDTGTAGGVSSAVLGFAPNSPSSTAETRSEDAQADAPRAARDAA